ncbi:MAG: two-component sensor histidine kinase [Desulfovibrio sp.]|nr:two-component sensor histidine kinase [Desulfovibrio sp.]|tara:strand:- start:50616 stop:52037 length:1422 start_codon:yes stop_codon:yes gene_type:complete
MPHHKNISIATKLTVWSCSLVVVFFSIAAYLFHQVRSDAELANRIVAVNHDLDSAIQRMLERLYSVQENIRRYRLIGTDRVVDFIVEDLNRFGELLDQTLDKHPGYAEEWKDLRQEFTITLTPTDEGRDTFAPNATVLEWTDILEQSLLDNQADMELSLTKMREAGERAATIGMYSLIICLVLSIGGGLILAYTLTRSLREIRRGIRQLGTGSAPRDVRVLSHDELGELAEAFNAMAERLRHEEAMRADFIAMLSHEIRTPLTSMRESVDLIAEGTFGEVTPKQRQFLDIAAQEAIRLSELLERLMTVSRMEAESLQLQLKSIDSAELVSTAVERILPAAQAKNISVESLLDPGIVCRCDPAHIQQVLLNLLGNAIKFSPETSIVTIKVEQAHDKAIFHVTDQGPGIPEEEQVRIFRKYYRTPEVRESIDGAGLGLSIVKRIIDAHGGKIHIESRPQQGATFRFTLPLDNKDI